MVVFDEQLDRIAAGIGEVRETGAQRRERIVPEGALHGDPGMCSAFGDALDEFVGRSSVGARPAERSC